MLAAGHVGVEHRQVGRCVGRVGGNAGQRVEHLVVVAAAEAGHRHHGAQPRVGRLQAGQPVDHRLRGARLAVQPAGLGRQGQHLGAGIGLVHQRRQRGQGLGHLAQQDLRACQVAACGGMAGCQGHGLGEVHLGLLRGAQLQLVLAGGQQQADVLGQLAQHTLEDLARLQVLAVHEGQLAFGHGGVQVFRRTPAQFGQLGAGSVHVALGHQQRHQRHAGRCPVGPQVDRLGEGLLRGRPAIGLAQVQFALQQPGVGQGRVVTQHAIDGGHAAGQVVVAGGEAGLHQQRVRRGGRRLQGTCQRRAGAGLVAHGGLGAGHRSLQPGLRIRVGQHCRAIGMDHPAGLAALQQGLGQQRQCQVLGGAVFQRALQFTGRGGGIAVVHVALAQQQPRRAGLGVRLHQLLQLGAGGGGVQAGQALLQSPQRLGVRPAAAGQADGRGGAGEREQGAEAGHGGYRQGCSGGNCKRMFRKARV